MAGAIFNTIKPQLAATMRGDGVRQLSFKCLEENRFDHVSMGTRPSGTMHMGNLFVLASCMHYLRINSEAQVHVDVMDLDFDNQRGGMFTPFINLPATSEFMHQLDAAIDILAKKLRVDPHSVKKRFFSDRLHGDSDLRSMLLSLAKDKTAVKSMKFAIASRPGRYDTPPISMICESCGQSNSNFAHYKSVQDRFVSECTNVTCGTGPYESDLASKPFNVHYLVDPVRDLLLPGAVLHMYGGDYGRPHGPDGTLRFLRVAAVMKAAMLNLGIETELPAFFITPLITDQHGKKISKSDGNGVPSRAPASPLSYLKDEIGHVIKLMELCIDGTLDGLTLMRSHEQKEGASCEAG